MRIMAAVVSVVFVLSQLCAGGVALSAGDNSPATRELSTLVAGNNEFAFDMYKKISESNQNKNIFFSPHSISKALGMTYVGARGNTEKQMAKVLHFSIPQNELHGAFASLSQTLLDSGPRVYQLSIANALWGQREYPFTADFLALVEKNYQGAFHTADFISDKEGSRQTINQWTEQNTAGKIKNLLQPDDIDELTRLVLTNAIYFKGDWAAKFKPEQTRTEKFQVQPNIMVDVPMMHQTGQFGYAVTNQGQVLELPYAGKELSMLIFLPKDSGPDIGAELSADALNHWLANLDERPVSVTLPKFKFEARYGLSSMLAKMGMPDAFILPGADFSGITGEKRLYITGVIHQAFIEVNEEGSEAAGATAVIMGTKSVAPKTPEFKADRPFTFLIRHKPTGAILFMGRIANPAVK